MKTIFENVIARGGYDLTGLLKNIDKYHVEGKLTDAEREELYAQARQEPVAQYDVQREIERLWAAVRALQQSSTGGSTPVSPSPYIQPTGAHDAYSAGNCVIYNGRFYESTLDNNVWAPDVYPAGWTERTDIAKEE